MERLLRLHVLMAPGPISSVYQLRCRTLTEGYLCVKYDAATYIVTLLFTSERGQPLYNGQNDPSQRVHYRDSTVCSHDPVSNEVSPPPSRTVPTSWVVGNVAVLALRHVGCQRGRTRTLSRHPPRGPPLQPSLLPRSLALAESRRIVCALVYTGDMHGHL